MNAKKTIAAIGLTGALGLGLGGITPAMASETGGTEHKGNSVSQKAHTKEKGESNREAAHAHAPGQLKKLTTPPVVEAPVVAPVVEDPKVETPINTSPEVETPVVAPIEAPVEVAPVVEAPADNISSEDNSSDEETVLSDNKVGGTTADSDETSKTDSNETDIGGILPGGLKSIF